MNSKLMSMEDLAAPTTATIDTGKLTYWQMSSLVAGLEAENRQLRQEIAKLQRNRE